MTSLMCQQCTVAEAYPRIPIRERRPALAPHFTCIYFVQLVVRNRARISSVLTQQRRLLGFETSRLGMMSSDYKVCTSEKWPS